MGLPPRSTAGGTTDARFWNNDWSVAVGLTLCLSGFEQHGCPLVIDAIRVKSFVYCQSVGQLGAVAFTDRSHVAGGTGVYLQGQKVAGDGRGRCPVPQSRINVDWLTFDPQMFAPLFPRLKEGILPDVFIQKAVVAWDNAPSCGIVVSLLYLAPMEANQWLQDVRTSRNMWPLQKTSYVMANQLATEIFMRRERRGLRPNWPWWRAGRDQLKWKN